MNSVDLAFLLWICPELLSLDLPKENPWTVLSSEMRTRWLRFREGQRHRAWQDWAKREGVRFTFPGADDYPLSLSIHVDAPFVLSYIGDPVWLGRPGVSILGTRFPSRVAERWMTQELPRFFQKFNGVVFSGAARGVDQMAHLLAVAQDVPTVAFLPLGLMDRYPPSIRDLEKDILKKGALISCFPPDWPIYKANFAKRNRLLTSVSKVTLMVEGRLKSGSAMSGKMVRENGGTLGVLPFDPFHHQGSANLQFLKQGAQLISEAEDLRALFDLVYAAESHQGRFEL